MDQEFELIRKLERRFSAGMPKGVLGIGDDCAVIGRMIITTDMLIEGTHFLREAILPSELGYKTLAVNLSDIAAKGGRPLYVFLSMGLPFETSRKWVSKFFAGFEKLLKKSGAKLLGGDTCLSKKQITLSVTVIGEVKPPHRLKLRSHAMPGDLICVTGPLGDSGAGLEIILNENYSGRKKAPKLSGAEAALVKIHHRPIPRLLEGQFLSKTKSVRAMMDLSDGLDSDICHILEKSKVGAHINLDQIPISKNLKEYFRLAKNGKISESVDLKTRESAAVSGEDYELLFTINEKNIEQVKKDFFRKFSRPFFIIGLINGRAGKLEYYYNGKKIKLRKEGFSHF